MLERSQKLERIDTGDYTPEEYDVFLREIRLVNRFAGDRRALRRSLFRQIEERNPKEVSVLDVGAGSGELLCDLARFARRSGRKARLAGLELNERSARSIAAASADFPEIVPVRGDARRLPFADGSFDYVFSSLFLHHLTDETIVEVLREMRRVARIGVIAIDLHRHRGALAAYRLFCAAFRISPLVREDGSLSIRRGFRPDELSGLATRAGLKNSRVTRSAPFRIVLTNAETRTK